MIKGYYSLDIFATSEMEKREAYVKYLADACWHMDLDERNRKCLGCGLGFSQISFHNKLFKPNRHRHD